MLRLLDVRTPLFVPVWRRVVVVALVFGWALLELSRGETGWALFFAAAGAWCGWQFFFDWRLPDDDDADRKG